MKPKNLKWTRQDFLKDGAKEMSLREVKLHGTMFERIVNAELTIRNCYGFTFAGEKRFICKPKSE